MGGYAVVAQFLQKAELLGSYDSYSLSVALLTGTGELR
jgi:hypothetical protein